VLLDDGEEVAEEGPFLGVQCGSRPGRLVRVGGVDR
jgi:hypothetical protein